MKIIGMDAFRKMPVDTVFRSAEEPFSFGEIMFLGSVHPVINDWVEYGFDIPMREDDVEPTGALFDMLDNCVSVPLAADMYGRHGLYPQKPIFMVYEKADLLILRERIEAAIAACDDGPAPSPHPA